MLKTICFSLALAVLLGGGSTISLYQSSAFVQKAVPAPKLFAEGIINTSADEYGPTFTPDGKRRFFASQRPVSGTVPKKGRDIDLWYVEPSRPLEYDDFLFLTFGNGSRFLKISEIKCISAAGSYSEVISADNQKSLVLKPLNEWEERLPDKYFARIHRATIINIAFVEQTEKWLNYSYQVYLRGLAEPFTMSRRHAVKLKEKLH